MGPKWVQKWFNNGPKMGSKMVKNGPLMVQKGPKGFKRGPNIFYLKISWQKSQTSAKIQF